MVSDAIFEPSQLGSFSRQMWAALAAAVDPATMRGELFEGRETDGKSLMVKMGSPTGDQERQIVVWVDEVVTPSLLYGPSHCHEADDAGGIVRIIDLISQIMSDRLVIAMEIGGLTPGWGRWLDLAEDDAILEELTEPYASGHFVIKTWTGAGDRDVQLEP